MAQDTVKARKVAGSMVVTLTAKILEDVDIKEGDEMVMETLGREAVLVRKAGATSASSRRHALEVDVLEKSVAANLAKATFEQMYYGGGTADALPVVASELNLAKARLALAEKRLQLFDLTGERDLDKALALLEEPTTRHSL